MKNVTIRLDESVLPLGNIPVLLIHCGHNVRERAGLKDFSKHAHKNVHARIQACCAPGENGSGRVDGAKSPDLVAEFRDPAGKLLGFALTGEGGKQKLQLQKEFSSCRGIYTGLNTGLVDLGLLRTVELYDRTLPRENIKRIYSEAMRENAWVIYYTHDVADPPSWIGCTPCLLEEAVS